MDYYTFAKRAFGIALKDSQMEENFFFLLMDMENGLRLPTTGGYHNLGHVMRVASLAYWAGKMSGLTVDECRALLLAGLFHDAGHARSAHINDRDNIAVAVSIFREWEFEGVDPNLVISLIQATTADGSKVARVITGTLAQKVMADADLLVLTDRDFEEHIIDGLKEEGYDAQPPQVFLGANGCFTEAGRYLFALSGLRVSMY